ncbi:hypothetical protein [Bifidobacterium choloepi]|uniref:Sugar ABC transporter substrate-binding protein n=1 Tax=Bifidobacterium choloepi TaxID=2614131 RepID=A0A6I5N0W8_9BIFI|nr:hypothetical protein [Bifidobacterium choloepi]NEG70106.1 hypothetical protein [Bifidobacterium choloepi]
MMCPNRRRIAATLLALAALLAPALAGCAPNGAAVGDTQSTTASPAHDSVQGARITVGIIGTAQDSETERQTDSAIATALTDYGMAAVYTSLQDVADPDTVARQAIADYIHRHVHAVMLCNLTLTDANRDMWTTSLTDLRNAGIAVVLVAPTDTPSDPDLYAAVLTVGDSSGAMPISTAIDDVVRDYPHERDLTVTTDPDKNTKLNGYASAD